MQNLFFEVQLLLCTERNLQNVIEITITLTVIKDNQLLHIATLIQIFGFVTS